MASVFSAILLISFIEAVIIEDNLFCDTTYWTILSGAFSFDKSSPCSVSSTNVYADNAATMYYDGPGSQSWANYKITVNMTLQPDNDVHDNGGLMFHAGTAGGWQRDSYGLRLSYLYQFAIIHIEARGPDLGDLITYNFTENNQKLELNKDYRFEIIFNDYHILVYWDAILIIDLIDTAKLHATGTVGLLLHGPIIYSNLVIETATEDPTAAPTQPPTNALSMDYIYNHVFCNNLDEHVHTEYDKNLSKCIDYCSMMEDCKLFNYFVNFKEIDDSRCYIFDKLCDIKADKTVNNSIIGYYKFNEECSNYPYNWIDNTGDNCDYYEDKNWCSNVTILRNESDFSNLVDNTYGYTAIDTCCECGGGIKIIDNVAMSFDNDWIGYNDDVLCSHEHLQYGHTSNATIRNWDNLVLYNLCNNLDEDINCNFLIDTQFHSETRYSLYLCNSNTLNGDIEFIFDILINSMDKTFKFYINPLWFKLDLSYYSPNINVRYLDYSQCVSNILYTNINEPYVYHYGAHPCYILDTISPTSRPTDEGNNKVWLIALLCGFMLSGICCIVLWVYGKHRKTLENEINDMEKKHIDMKISAMTFENNNNNMDTVHQPLAPELEENNNNNMDTVHRDRPSAPELEENNNVAMDNNNSSYCILCCDSVANMFNDPCGHVTYCDKCVSNALNINNKCPNCRVIIKCKKIYKAGFDTRFVE